MFAEARVVQDMYYIVRPIRIFLQQSIKDFQFDHSLLYKSFLVSNDFDGHVRICFMIKSPDHLAKTALSDYLQYLVTKCYMIMFNLKSFDCISNQNHTII